MDRRGFLSIVGVGVFAGCSSGLDGGSTPTPEPTPEPTPTDTPTPTPTPSPTPTPDPYTIEYVTENAQSPAYDTLFRQFDDYEGEPVHFAFGYVYQSIYNSDGGADYHQVEVTNDQSAGYQGDIAMLWDGDTRLLEGDVIELWGIAEDLYEYETVQGDVRTIPRITLVEFELIEEG